MSLEAVAERWACSSLFWFCRWLLWFFILIYLYVFLYFYFEVAAPALVVILPDSSLVCRPDSSLFPSDHDHTLKNTNRGCAFFSKLVGVSKQ